MLEVDRIRERYARRSIAAGTGLYSPMDQEVLLASQARDRAMVRLLSRHHGTDLSGISILEVGCGTGSNLLKMIELGVDPANLVGNELLAERAALARVRLPQRTVILVGDACELDLPAASFDIVMQFVVFTSILDDGMQAAMAKQMWSLLKPGGAVLWYDFTYDNPRNPDVRGVPLSRIHRLFPRGSIQAQRLTLAPPLARPIVKLSPALYRIADSIPALRTHLLCWIGKGTTP